MSVMLLLTLDATGGVIEDLQPGHWLEIPNSRMESVFPSPTPLGNSGSASVMNAWSGGAYDSDRDQLVVWGGGHCDYAGNELYGFQLSSLQWVRLTDPTPNSQISQNVSHYADGRPTSRHTYDMLSYLPNVGKFVSAGGTGYFCGSSNGFGRATDLFNFTANKWERGASHPDIGGTIGRVSAYDPATGHLWVHGSQGGYLAEYNPVSDSWTRHGSSRYLTIYGKAAIDPVRRKMLLVGGYGGNRQIYVWDLTNPSAAPTVPSTSGDRTLETSAGIGLEYDPVSDRYVGWKGGASVYVLNPDTWAWSKVNPSAGNSVTPTAANSNGTYGRFRYVPSRNVFVAVNKTDQNVYFYRLTAGAGNPGPQVTLQANPASVAYQGSTTLSWSTSGAQSCSASGDWSGARSTSGSATVGPLTADSSFSLECINSAGTATTRVANVSVADPLVASLELEAIPAVVVVGGNSNLVWNSASVDSCTASGGWTGSQPVSGSLQVGPLDQETTFDLDCTGPGGAVARSVTVTVQQSVPPPTLNLSAAPTTINEGEAAELTWWATDVTTCSASGGWAGAKSPLDQESTGPLTQTTDFTLSCAGPSGDITRTVRVVVEPAPDPQPQEPDPPSNQTPPNLIQSIPISQDQSAPPGAESSGGGNGIFGSGLGGIELISLAGILLATRRRRERDARG